MYGFGGIKGCNCSCDVCSGRSEARLYDRNDPPRPVKVHKVTLMIVDHDVLGHDGVREVLENARYPNHCMYPRVMDIETVEVQWNDSHPLNKRDSRDVAFEELFA